MGRPTLLTGPAPSGMTCTFRPTLRTSAHHPCVVSLRLVAGTPESPQEACTLKREVIHAIPEGKRSLGVALGQHGMGCAH